MTAASGPWAGKEIGRSRWNGNGLSGADGNRNHDLFDANEALYQLSYSPVDVVVLRMTTRYTLVRPIPKRKSACVPKPHRSVAASHLVHEGHSVCERRHWHGLLRRNLFMSLLPCADCDAECMCGVAICKGAKPDMRIATLEDGFASQPVHEPASVCGLRRWRRVLCRDSYVTGRFLTDCDAGGWVCVATRS